MKLFKYTFIYTVLLTGTLCLFFVSINYANTSAYILLAIIPILSLTMILMSSKTTLYEKKSQLEHARVAFIIACVFTVVLIQSIFNKQLAFGGGYGLLIVGFYLFAALIGFAILTAIFTLILKSKIAKQELK